MSAHKITFEFEASTGDANTAGSKHGWSESWYYPLDVSDAIAESRADSLAIYRRGILTPGWSLVSARISQLSPAFNLLRRGRLVFYSPGDAVGRFSLGTAGLTRDEQPYDAMEVAVSSGNGRRRNFQLRGIPSSAITAGARNTGNARFTSAFDLWAGYLAGTAPGVNVASPWSIRFRTAILPTGATSPVRVLTAVSIAGGPSPAGTPESPVLTLIDATNITAGATVTLRGVQGMRRMNGTWLVLVAPSQGGLGANQIRLAPKRRVIVQGEYISGGTLSAFTYGLDNIDRLSQGHGTSRRTGRPPNLTRGRRSNREQ